jgi:phage gp37-like protein
MGEVFLISGALLVTGLAEQFLAQRLISALTRSDTGSVREVQTQRQLLFHAFAYQQRAMLHPTCVGEGTVTRAFPYACNPETNTT